MAEVFDRRGHRLGVGERPPTQGLRSSRIGQNYPNPFNPSTRIEFSIPGKSYVSLKVYNLLGEEMCELAGKEFSAGKHSVTFDASRMANGLYFYSIEADRFIQARRMVLLR
jgi:hypothetical protein